ncbi:MAG: DNA recombination protein RmuC [bacterium]
MQLALWLLIVFVLAAIFLSAAILFAVQKLGAVVQERQGREASNWSEFAKTLSDQRAGLAESLGRLETSARQMQKIGEEVDELNRILASPKLQGNFGEVALERLLTDILPKESFELQPRLAEGCQPDAVIKIKDLKLCIDAKFPKDRLAAVLFAARDEAARAEALKEFARTVRGMAVEIAQKYVRPELGTTDQAFLFVPSENLYYEILQLPDLTAQCRKLKVTIVSPNTLAAALYATALAFRGHQMQENVQRALKMIEELARHFDNFRQDFSGVGDRLRKAQDDYDKAARDLERFERTLVKLRDGQEQTEKNSL